MTITDTPGADLVPVDNCAACHTPAPIGDPCPNCGILARENDRSLPSFNTRLPGSLGDALAALDVWDLDVITRGIDRKLALAIDVAAQTARKEREAALGGPDAVIGEADAAPLVRRLADAADVLERIGKAFLAASKAAREQIAEEARIVHPAPNPGYTTPRALVIPDGNTDITAREKVDRRNVWDDDMVAAVIAEDIAIGVMRDAVAADDAPGEDYVDGVRDGAVRAVHRTRELLSKADWKVTALDTLRKVLLSRGDDVTDRLAGILERAKTVVENPTGEFEVKRVQSKRG